ncbi:FtsX-like permease family protein [Aliikangiella marina]|uniref:FtsX-like permease family protein n=1 Tax=Aliikangiella marina TaxID=1712262 RepID=A0A545T517_9GAMM|nr:ADOP family duplicated permease [Aliikangiella marina]TQV72309.1 FtsX-like permease family protein [Aliikangiella marina]
MLNFQDFKYAIRLLSKRPGFTALTISVMAVGLGLSIYLFSFLNTMAFKPLPFKDAENLIIMDSKVNGMLYNGGSLDLHDYHEIRTNLKGIAEFSAVDETSANVSGRDGARRYNAALMETNMFQITRTQPLMGRSFTETENQVGAENVAVIGYDMWRNHFGGDPEVLSQSVRVNGVTTKIIGVMPEGYFFPRNAEIWMPARQDATQMQRGEGGSYTGLAHLAPGTTLADINRQLEVIMKRLEERYPKTNNGQSAYATTFPMSTMGNGGNAFLAAMYIVAILLLILASINVGNLLLSRAIERSKETAIRVALGAPRSRLIGQMLWESIIICSVGGIIGLLVAAWGLEVTESITATFTDDKPFFWWKFGVDSFTIKIFFVFVIGTILVTGLLPAWKNSGADFNSVLRDGTRGALGKKSGRLNRLLVMSEVFLSLTVLIAASVMVVGTYIATNADYGADTDDVLTARVRLTQAQYDTPEKRAQFVEVLESRLQNTVGISKVSISSDLPGEYAWRPTVAIEGKEYVDEKSFPRATYIATSHNALKNLGVELRQGRYFDSSDKGLDKSTVVVTESFVERHFDSESPIGKRIRIVEVDGETPRWLTIVGVVEHTIQGQSFSPVRRDPSVFRPISQAPRLNLIVAMKLTAEQTVAIRSLRKTLESIDSDLPAYLIKPYQTMIDRNTAGIGFASKIFLMFAIVAVILASSGIYGVMSNTVVQRTQEIGVKRALGASDEKVTREFLWKGAKQFIWGGIPGLLAGGGLGFMLGQLMATGVVALGSISIVIVVIIGSVVLFATYLPTKKALQLEPSEALRYE